jgi:hypothetical protein
MCWRCQEGTLKGPIESAIEEKRSWERRLGDLIHKHRDPQTLMDRLAGKEHALVFRPTSALTIVTWALEAD